MRGKEEENMRGRKEGRKSMKKKGKGRKREGRKTGGRISGTIRLCNP